MVGRDSVVGIATRYGLHGPGFELRRGYRVFSPRVKRPGHVVSYPPPSSAEVKERVELYLYLPSGHS